MARHLSHTRARPRGRIATLTVVLALSLGIAAIAQSADPRTELQAAQADIDQAQALQVQEDARLASAEAHIQAALVGMPTSTTSTSVPASTSSSTTAVPTTTSTTIAPTTTATTAPPTTTTTAPPGTYGTSGTGPTLEPCTTTGTVVTSTAAVTSGPQNSTILLRGGTYATGFTVPQGSTVKPYNCETVQINAAVNVNNNSTIAGLSITANSAGWALRVTSRINVEIRNSVIKGGVTEAIRVDGTSNNVRFVGVHIDGGDNNHSMKVKGESAGPHPTNILIRNVLFTKIHFGGGEDLLQLEQHGLVTIDHTTFRDNPTGEDGLDVKDGAGLTVTGSLFLGANINAECMLVQGNFQASGTGTGAALISGNHINGCSASLGAHPEGNHNPSWDFLGNLMSNNALVQLRRSFDAEVRNNTWTGGGQMKLGTATSNDFPTNAMLSSNNFGSATWNKSNPNSTFTCDGTNSGTGSAGSACS